MTPEKKIAFGLWSNDPQRINEPGQCGLLDARIFQTEKAARDHFRVPPYRTQTDDVIVRLTIETVD